jgi:hypothetical protein
MTIEQTITIPADHQLTINVPREVPVGRAIITFTPVPGVIDDSELFVERDIELINRNAERLNQEALDVLSFQNIDI